MGRGKKQVDAGSQLSCQQTERMLRPWILCDEGKSGMCMGFCLYTANHQNLESTNCRPAQLSSGHTGDNYDRKWRVLWWGEMEGKDPWKLMA
jgi:hypothetical protein